MTHRDQFFGQKRHDPLGAAVQFWRYGFVQRGDLSDTHKIGLPTSFSAPTQKSGQDFGAVRQKVWERGRVCASQSRDQRRAYANTAAAPVRGSLKDIMD
jgi:hypothetical protein